MMNKKMNSEKELFSCNGMMFTSLNGYSLHQPDEIDIVTGKKFKDVKSKHEYGYSYDEFLQWEVKRGEFKGYGNDPAIHGLYSDRLFQWDHVRHDKICQEVFGNQGQYWDRRNPKDIEKFLQLYCKNDTLSLRWIIEGCNPSSGYPYWVFGYKDGK